MLRGGGETLGVQDDIQRAARDEITAMLEYESCYGGRPKSARLAT